MVETIIMDKRYKFRHPKIKLSFIIKGFGVSIHLFITVTLIMNFILVRIFILIRKRMLTKGLGHFGPTGHPMERFISRYSQQRRYLGIDNRRKELRVIGF